MKGEQDKILIAYILDTIAKISSLTEQPDFDKCFNEDWVIHDAVVRRLQTLSESTQRLSITIKEAFPEIPWHQISGFRNILVHQYLGDLEPERLLHVIRVHLPLLQEKLSAYRCE